MEYGSNWDYYTLINELTQGMEQAKQLRVRLSSASTETQELLLQRILSSYEKALLILKWNGTVGQSAVSKQQQQQQPQASGAPESSSVSVDCSPRNENQKDYQDVSKKRKTQPTWTEQVRVNPESGLEGPSDDNYSWRKYGQKDILGAKYPRSYYRCTYRHLRNCWATKQVQRSDDDPTVFEITYRGIHVCNPSMNNNNSVPQPQQQPQPPSSPEKQEMKHTYNYNTNQQQPNEMLMNFRTNLRVKTGESSESNDTRSPFSFASTYQQMDGESQIFPVSTIVEDSILGVGYSPSFISPATSGSNYFSLSPYQIINNQGTNHTDSDLTEILSATASATNSPIAGLDFSYDSVELDPNFNFSASGFFQ
ncbi:OLC1v1029996C1 [Oldenlandia corymbosa var. corymbosa]|uniref:OLC1v1029996C1 n=1 Tax=Oldenlandia corymbosa var. corymbosa TaxID=529605 RepID=A0AAV1CI52_OLDCO|nr:OLC1v1029996C1 [Oldenlandia corymbosa var. corymbosa]